MTTTVSRPTGALLLTALIAMIASAVIVVPSGLTLNPADPAATLAAVHDKPGLHLLELALDVLGWLALTTAGLLLAVRPWPAGVAAGVAGRVAGRVAAGLLAAAGLAGLLHDAGNLAVTQLAADPANAPIAAGLLLTAKWTVNLAGLLWVAATAAMSRTVMRRTGAIVAVSGLAAVVLPWTTGTTGPSPALEQAGYLLHLPVMLWWQFVTGRLDTPNREVDVSHLPVTESRSSPREESA